MIRVDPKNKVGVGNFKNPGRCSRRHLRQVLDHDFPSEVAGRTVPVGVYDIDRDDGVAVGTSREMPTFEASASHRWWLAVGGHWFQFSSGRIVLLVRGE